MLVNKWFKYGETTNVYLNIFLRLRNKKNILQRINVNEPTNNISFVKYFTSYLWNSKGFHSMDSKEWLKGGFKGLIFFINVHPETNACN